MYPFETAIFITAMHFTSELELLYDLLSLILLDPDSFSLLHNSNPSDLDCSGALFVQPPSVGSCLMLCASLVVSFSFSLRLSLMIILSSISPFVLGFSNFFSLFIWMLSKSSDLKELSFIFLRSKFTVSGGGFSLSAVPCPCDVEASLNPYVILDLSRRIYGCHEVGGVYIKQSGATQC
jgi:hypothetical protein